MTAPICLRKARALIEADGRLTYAGRSIDGREDRYDDGRAWACPLAVREAFVVADIDWRDLADRIERECRLYDAEGLRRLGLAVHAWGAAASALVSMAETLEYMAGDDDVTGMDAELLRKVAAATRWHTTGREPAHDR